MIQRERELWRMNQIKSLSKYLEFFINCLPSFQPRKYLQFAGSDNRVNAWFR